MKERSYIAIDLKSFYASVECVERGLDPLTTNLVVADESRTEKTICLAVTPSLKAYGISGRARLFEVVQQVAQVNALRREKAPGRKFAGESWDDTELKRSPQLAVSYLVAPPRMACYMKYSTRIYDIYLRYIAPEDIHVYSVDEVFMDVTDYLATYKMTPRQLAQTMIREVLRETGITATAGIGTNLYLSKVAMDIVAKHIPPDKDGVRIAELTEQDYREKLWDHRPLTDFWRVGPGIARKLEARGMKTMGDVARCSVDRSGGLWGEELLYRLFGVNAELLIDHAWGYEPCTIADIKAYRPSTNSLSSGQVLQYPYPADKARMVMREMTDAMALQLVEKGLVTDLLVLTVGYDRENLMDASRREHYRGAVTIDHYGRAVPKQATGSVRLDHASASCKLLCGSVMELFDRIVDPELLVRRMTISAGNLISEKEAAGRSACVQMDLFGDQEENARQEARERREKELQKTVIRLKHKYGKNAVLRGMNLEEGATAIQRNAQIGGHRA